MRRADGLVSFNWRNETHNREISLNHYRYLLPRERKLRRIRVAHTVGMVGTIVCPILYLAIIGNDSLALISPAPGLVLWSAALQWARGGN